MLLAIDNVGKSFKGIRAVSGASFDVAENSIVAMIGPNGAGKTTIFNLVAGVYAPDGGEIRFAGKRISGLEPEQICAAGIGRTFQIVKPFAGLSVLDNVIVGALHKERNVIDARKRAQGILEQLGMAAKAQQPAAALTLPERKRLEVARALATRPRLLLLDEVMAGLRPTEVDGMVRLFETIHREEGMTILLIEHVMRAVMALAQHIVVLHHGEIIARGEPAQVVKNEAVLACYLGSEAVSA